MNEKEFFNFKKQILHCPDASKKGDIDEKFKNIIDSINRHEDYVTLSSCSGRTAVVVQSSGEEVQKDGCQWAYCSHDTADPSELIKSVNSSLNEGNLSFKFEPFILHVACRGLDHAKRMLSAALRAGCKNSGMVVGRRDRFTVAARNTLQMEVPISSNGKLLVSEEYLLFLVSQANEKMTKNDEKLQKFAKSLVEVLDPS